MEKLPRFVERALRPGRAFYRFCCPPGSASLAALTMSAPQEIFDLIARFEQHVEAYKAGQYNETQLRRDFLDPFFKALGWDVDNAAGYAEAYRDVLHEDAVKVGGLTKAPDYGFRIGGNRKFFLEAKKPSVCIKDEIAPAYQLRRYAWNAKLPLSILSDFEEFAVYDGRVKPFKDDKAGTARVFYCTYREYAEKWDWITSIFSKDAVLRGSFDKYAETHKTKRGTAEVDADFLATIEGWRKELAQNLALRNPRLTQRELNFAVQRIIDRIIFLRICEDRGIEDYGRLQALVNGPRIYPRLCQLFEAADARYNSGLFHFKAEKGRPESPDELTLRLDVDDKLLRDLFKGLYYPDSPYEFRILSADILGQVYEQFLGKVIRLTDGHRAVVEDKPEVKKAGGVYYTPTYIVDYIVRQTVGKLLSDIGGQPVAGGALPPHPDPLPRGEGTAAADLRKSKAPDSLPALDAVLPLPKGEGRRDARSATAILNRVAKLRILDPACGSGSFLIGAYQFLLDWHLLFYLANDPEKWAKGKKPALVQTTRGWRLTIDERKRILLNNIYGVDIDSQAVEVTKLSLLLKVLEGETGQSLEPLFNIFHERALPDLGDNIKCGNSLIGPDFYQQAELPLLTDEERYRINVFDWPAEFPEVFRRRRGDEAQTSAAGELRETPAAPMDYTLPGVPLHGAYGYKKVKTPKSTPARAPVEPEWEGGFDAVIGNPPYIPIESMTEVERHYYQTHFPQLERKYDSAPIFILANLAKLSPSGRLGFISSVTWQTGENYAQLRRHLFTAAGVETLINLPFDIFKDAYVDTGIYVLTARPTPGYQIFRYPKKTKVHQLGELSLTFVPRAQIVAPDFKVVLDPQAFGILHRTMGNSSFVDFGSVSASTQGLAGNRFVTVGSAKGKDWFPYLVSGQARRYFLEVEATAYTDMVDKASLQRFYEAEPKILIRRVISRQDRLLCAFTEDRLVFKKDINPFIVTGSKSHSLFLLGILNSRLLSYLYVNTSSIATKDDFRQTTLAELRKLPVPRFSAAETRQARLVKLVEQMLELHRQLAAARTPQEQTALERQITATDTQIDRLVYDLYGLTEDEIAIVEGRTS
jgi:hypothetical protein